MASLQGHLGHIQAPASQLEAIVEACQQQPCLVHIAGRALAQGCLSLQALLNNNHGRPSISIKESACRLCMHLQSVGYTRNCMGSTLLLPKLCKQGRRCGGLGMWLGAKRHGFLSLSRISASCSKGCNAPPPPPPPPRGPSKIPLLLPFQRGPCRDPHFFFTSKAFVWTTALKD